MSQPKTAVIASGTGRYADPWHPFPETTPRLQEILEEHGYQVTVDEDLDHAMLNLDGVDLLVVNAGDPWLGEEPTETIAPREAIAAFDAALERGIGIIALHCATATMRDYPRWASTIGGMWVPKHSYHPPLSHTRITGSHHGSFGLVEDFDVEDERYSRMQLIGPSTVIATHEGPHGQEPTVWVREIGNSRAAVDVLGHDARSYDSAGHRKLLGQLADWVTDR